MKKLFLILAACLCVGCANKAQSSVSSEVEDTTTPISQTDFSTSTAENVFNMAVRNHCKVTNQSCTVQKVVVQGDNIYGTYTYTENEQEYTVTGTLEDVQVSNVNNSFVTIAKKTFSSGIISTMDASENAAEDADEAYVTQTGLPYFDLPSELEEGTTSSSDYILEQDNYKILLLNIASGAMNFSGNYEGEGTYKIIALTLDQSAAYDIVSLEGSGSFDETTSLEGGWYYIVIERSDGTATLSWASQ